MYKGEQHIVRGGFKEALERFGCIQENTLRFGWNNLSAGALVTKDQKKFWLRVQYAPSETVIEDKKWRGFIDAEELKDIPKPKLTEKIDWKREEVSFRGLLFEYIAEKTASETPLPSERFNPDKGYLTAVRTCLETLATYKTNRVCVRPELLQRKLKDHFNIEGISLKEKEWCTIHGDIHWGNITYPNLYVLDWEAWGTGPRAYDPALLLTLSLNNQVLSSALEETFSDILSTKEGYLTQLFVCAEILEMIQRDPIYKVLNESLKQRISLLLKKLSVYS